MTGRIDRRASLDSDYRPLCTVALPYAGRRRYMHSFDLSDPVMAEGFDDYLVPVAALCHAAGATGGVAHMTVDEQVVAAGMSQRRPGPHVDGCFMPGAQSWGHGGGGWLHSCNDIRTGPVRRMAVIVAASVPGCRAWRGTFEGRPASDGDLSHIRDLLGAGDVLPAGVGYLLSPDCVHESIVFGTPTRRSFLRIALPAEFTFSAGATPWGSDRPAGVPGVGGDRGGRAAAADDRAAPGEGVRHGAGDIANCDTGAGQDRHRHRLHGLLADMDREGAAEVDQGLAAGDAGGRLPAVRNAAVVHLRRYAAA